MSYYDAMDVRQVRDEYGGDSPDPPLDDTWTDVDKLRWKAGLAQSESGLRVQLSPAESYVNGEPVPGRYSVCVRADGDEQGRFSIATSFDYEDAWTYLNGLVTGAQAARWHADPDGAQSGDLV